MKVSITTKALRAALESVTKVISQKTTVLGLRNYLFEGDGESLTITGGDGDTFIRETVSCKAEGKGLLPQNLLALVRTLPDGDITIGIDNNTATISWDCGSSKFPFSDASDYPMVPDGGDELLTINAEPLMKALAYTVPHADGNDLRPVTKCVYIRAENSSIDFVASDTHTLGLYTITMEHGGNFELLVPASDIKRISGLANANDEVRIASNGKSVFFYMDKTVLICRNVQSKYPNYRSIIPSKVEATLTVDKDSLLGAVKRTLICADKVSECIRFSLGMLETKIESQDLSLGVRAREVVDGAAYEGQEMVIGFKGEYLIRSLETCDEQECKINLVAPTIPAVLTSGSDSCLTLIIPSRI